MNEHAKKIWLAWLDGKPIQYRESPHSEWIDAGACQPNVVVPHLVPSRWRIKPSTETQTFRVYLHKLNNSPSIFRGSIAQEDFERSSHFGGWLTDWISYEVEVEEQ